jgi:WD40 repeat protein
VFALGYDSEEAEILAVSGEGLMNAWQMPGGEAVRTLSLSLPHGWYVTSAAFSQDGKRVAVGMYNGALLVCDSENGALLAQQWLSEDGSLMKVAFSPDGDLLAVGFANGLVKVWQMERLMEN